MANDDEPKLELQLLKAMFTAGQNWLSAQKTDSWARQCYMGGRSAITLYDNDIKLTHTIRAAKAGHAPAEFMVLPSDPTAEKDKYPPVTLMRIVPSEGATGDVPRHLNFHVCSHRRDGGGRDQVLVWRIEGPEGATTDHNFCHMQPIRSIDEFDDTCFPEWMPTRFPTFPMAANSSLEITIAACIATSGKSAVVRAVSPLVDVRKRVDMYISRLEAWA